MQLRQREQRLKILLFFNRTRKNTLLLRPGTVASADRARSLIILQTPTRNVQELAKEEREESEVKLRGAIRNQRGSSPPLQAASETPGGQLLRSTDIIFWIRVRFRAASAGGNQFRRSRLFFLLTAYAKHTGLVAAGVIVNPPSPPTFFLLLASFAASLPQLFCS